MNLLAAILGLSGEKLQEVTLFTNNDYSNPVYEIKLTSAQVDNSSQIIGTPVESGKESFDNKIINPKTIHLRGFVNIDDERTFLYKVEFLLNNRDWRFCSLVTRTNMINNLQLIRFVEVHSNDKIDVVEYEIELKEVLITKDDEDEDYDPSSSYVSYMNTGKLGIL